MLKIILEPSPIYAPLLPLRACLRVRGGHAYVSL